MNYQRILDGTIYGYMTSRSESEEDRCPFCNVKIDAAGCTDKEFHLPEPGSISICAKCGEVSVFGDTLKLRRMTDEEAAGVAADPACRKTIEKVRKHFKTPKQGGLR